MSEQTTTLYYSLWLFQSELIENLRSSDELIVIGFQLILITKYSFYWIPFCVYVSAFEQLQLYHQAILWKFPSYVDC